MTRQAARAVEVAGIEPKQMSTGLARESAMLSRKMTSLVEAIELHEEP
jgi:acetyl-CoA acetyltransferase